MNDRELACCWAATASTATVILACGLATPRWWLAAMVFLTLSTAVTRAATHTTTGSARVVAALRVIVLCVVLGLLVTLLASRSLAMASLFYLGIAPLLGTESLLVLVGCALVFVPVADPTQPYSVLARAVYVATWALVLLTAVVRASHRLRTPIAGYATLYTAGRQVSVSRAVRRPLGWALAGALVAAAVMPLGPPRPVGLPAGERSDGVPGGTAETARIDLAAVGDVDLGVRGEPRTIWGGRGDGGRARHGPVSSALGEAPPRLFNLDGLGAEAIELGGAVIAGAHVAGFFKHPRRQNLAAKITLVERLAQHCLVYLL